MWKDSFNNSGFTLLELLLAVAAIGIIAGFALPVAQSFSVRNDLDIAAVSTVQNLRRAQLLSQASDGNTTWGFYVQSGSLTLFKGASYATRDSTYDETTTVPTAITPSGVSEVVFAKTTGLPTTTGTITLTSSTNETRSVVLNSKGMISY